MYQLQIARKIGFNIPKSLISNNPKIINDFVKNIKNIIIKPISHGLQVTKNNYYSIYTSKFKVSSYKQSENLLECPIFIQEQITNYRDIRATVVGKEIFCVEIIKDNENEIDWRKPSVEKKYKLHFLPDSIKKLIIKLHKKLNLIYSAIDFILTPEHKYIFLEINPAGEWVWLERQLDLPISQTLIKELKG